MLIAIVITAALVYAFLPGAERAAARKIVGSIKPASTLKLYEGLPHQMFEKQLRESELATNETIRIGGHPFYATKLWVAEDIENTLRDLTSASSSYERYTRDKKCGGFHPDYALVWSDHESSTQILLCFGCEEALLEGEALSVVVDLNASAAQSLQGILKPLRKHRPLPQFP